ncbi:MAG: hypothetical protein KAH56_07470 [Candidatus Krumholzibacteria bacterium]|nr:hypothetical protein [Candidatus Krumholzibacteria bacterium]
MKRLILMLTGFLGLYVAVLLSGCAPMPYQGGPDYYVEVIYVPVPMPYPEPCPGPSGVQELPPPPARAKPLIQPRDNTPRTKVPTGDRSPHKPVIIRGKGGSERRPEQIAGTTPKRPPRKR